VIHIAFQRMTWRDNALSICQLFLGQHIRNGFKTSGPQGKLCCFVHRHPHDPAVLLQVAQM
jgi:hypothetical protein